MRKTFLLVFCLLTGIIQTFAATDLWTGSVKYTNWAAEGDATIVIEASKLSSAESGDKLGAECTSKNGKKFIVR